MALGAVQVLASYGLTSDYDLGVRSSNLFGRASKALNLIDFF